MKNKIRFVRLLLCFWILLGITSLCYAGSADVLPKGISSLQVKYSYYFPVTQQFDKDGNKIDVSEYFNSTLNSNIFPALGDLEAGFGMPAGSANVGDSVVDFKYNFMDLKVTYAYGILDRLSLGVEIPYYWNKTNVTTARVDTSNATVGFNPDYGTPGDPFGVPLIPVAFGGVQNDALATELAQSELESLGFKRIEDWNDSGFSDIRLGLKYQYFKDENFRLAFTTGVQLPTGETDDPDNLVDTGFGLGAWAPLFRLHNDFIGVKNLLLNFTFKYDLVLPAKETLRVPDSVNQPITANKEKVDRDIGDIFEFEFEGTYDFLESLSLTFLYNYSFKLKDKVSGDQGFDYESLEDETDATAHYIIAGLNYTTIPLYREKKFPLPLTFSFEYENWFAGSNGTLEQELLNFNVTAFF